MADKVTRTSYPNQPKWKVRGPCPGGGTVDYEVFYTAKAAKKYAKKMGRGFFVAPIQWRKRNV